MSKKKISPVGDSFDQHMKEILTVEEYNEAMLKAFITVEILKARREKKMTQVQLQEVSGVKQSVITKLERGETSPQILTIMKLLHALGKTLAVVPLVKGEEKKKTSYSSSSRESSREAMVAKNY